MMKDIEIDKIIRSKRRTFTLEIKSDARLIVRAPEHASYESIQKIVYKKRSWISKKQKLAEEKYKKVYPKEFVNGEGFLYLGDTYKLCIIDKTDASLTLNTNGFVLAREHVEDAKEVFKKWYRKEARKKISERVAGYSALSGIRYNKVNITNAQKRWGSCSAKGNLNFSWRLIMAPLKVIDYVVVHELAHIEEKNHSKKFWGKVKIMLPDYEKHKNWLKENEWTLIY